MYMDIIKQHCKSEEVIKVLEKYSMTSRSELYTSQVYSNPRRVSTGPIIVYF